MIPLHTTLHGLPCPRNSLRIFHLWYSLNNIVDDTIRLRLFQRTLIGIVTKWYVEQPSATHGTFSALITAFLTYFQLPIHRDSGMKLLTHFRQTPTVHISDHLHKWRRRRSQANPISRMFCLLFQGNHLCCCLLISDSKVPGEKGKVRFPCRLCEGRHQNHLFPQPLITSHPMIRSW